MLVNSLRHGLFQSVDWQVERVSDTDSHLGPETCCTSTTPSIHPDRHGQVSTAASSHCLCTPLSGQLSQALALDAPPQASWCQSPSSPLQHHSDTILAVQACRRSWKLCGTWCRSWTPPCMPSWPPRSASTTFSATAGFSSTSSGNSPLTRQAQAILTGSWPASGSHQLTSRRAAGICQSCTHVCSSAADTLTPAKQTGNSLESLVRLAVCHVDPSSCVRTCCPLRSSSCLASCAMPCSPRPVLATWPCDSPCGAVACQASRPPLLHYACSSAAVGGAVVQAKGPDIQGQLPQMFRTRL